MRSTLRICASALGLLLATATASLGSEPAPMNGGALDASAWAPTPAACCKVCVKGKACGNTCIARDKSCHQPPGCACDG